MNAQFNEYQSLQFNKFELNHDSFSKIWYVDQRKIETINSGLYIATQAIAIVDNNLVYEPSVALS